MADDPFRSMFPGASTAPPQSTPRGGSTYVPGPPIVLESIFASTDSQGVKVQVYGRTGVGKTVLGLTAPNPVFLSAESGLLSLRKVIGERRRFAGWENYDPPKIEITSIGRLRDARLWIEQSSEAKQFETYVLDSITEIAEQILIQAKAENRHGIKAYGEMAEDVLAEFRAFRDIRGKNVVFIAQEISEKTGPMGGMRHSPAFPGQATGPRAPYFFDEVFRLTTGSIDPATGQIPRFLQTQPTEEYEAKDRSGMLDNLEWPDLSNVFNKIRGL